MKYPHELIRGTLIKRYKRFLADIRMEDDSLLTVHCPNPGSMKTCSSPGFPAYLSRSDNPKRKLAYTLELVHNGNCFIGVNTTRANGVVHEALIEKGIPSLSKYNRYRLEVGWGESRIDILAETPEESCLIEIKSVSMMRGQAYAFPDSVTERGYKHLNELERAHKQGHRAMMLFLIMRSDAEVFEPAEEIDPRYARRLREVTRNGVEVLVYGTRLSSQGLSLGDPVPYRHIH